MPNPTASSRWHSRAFGLTVEGDFPTELFENDATSETRLATVSTAAPHDFAEHWATERAVRLFEGRRPNGRLVMTISADSELGYHVWAEAHGDYVISPDGARIHCFPGQLPSSQWQRFLVGQVLPLAASLQGLETLHASAVCISDRAVGFVGDSGAGKTSVAANLLLMGATFLADDVITVERCEDGLLVHPGTPLIGIKSGQDELIGELASRELAIVVTADHEETLCRVARPSGPVPLGPVYFIDRDSYRGPLRFDPIDDVRLLMSATFNIVHRDPSRLERLLDVSVRIATGAGAYWIRVPEAASPGEVARSVERHLAESAQPGFSPEALATQ